ncbi:MAG: uL22 family ribosomal protein [Nanoarchaeota archaeon]
MTENKKQTKEEKVDNKELESTPSEKPISNESEVKEEKKEIKEKPKKEIKKKTSAVVNGINLHMSTKQAAAICRFIKWKEIKKAVQELKEVSQLRRAIPMKGEIPHRKNIGPGRYPQKASKAFVELLNTLSANAETNGLENPIIAKAVANIASRPYGKFGAVRKKRSHVEITAIDKKEKTHSDKKAMEGKKN